MRILALLAIGWMLLPFLVVQVPPIVDYPNHLARMWLIAGGAHESPLDAIYSVDWGRAATNVGIDLAALAFGRVLGAETLARLMLALSLVLPVIGAVALARATMGRWHAMMLLLPLAAWNSCFVLGFMNQQIAVGLALLAAAAERASGARAAPATLGLRAAAATVIAMVHPFGALVHAGVLGGLALGPDAGWWRRLSLAILAAAVPLMVFSAAMVLAPRATGAGETSLVAQLPAWMGAVAKVQALTAPFATYAPISEALAGLGAIAALVVALLAGIVVAHRGLVVAAGGFLVAALVAPNNVGDTAQVDLRFACVALPLFLVACAPRAATAPGWRAVGAVLLVLCAARTAWIGSVWRESRADMAAIEAVLEPVPPGSAILVLAEPVAFSLRPERPWRMAAFNPAYRHLGALAVPRRRAFVPVLFSATGKQPIRVLAPHDVLAAPDGEPLPPHLLEVEARGGAPVFAYLRHWRRDFDYVLLLNATADSAMPTGLVPVRDAGFARLWRIGR